MSGISGFLLKFFGWKVDITIPDYPKCIICVAPHTSNWDFIIGKLAYASLGRQAGFLMKDTWFFCPLGSFFRYIGGVEVPRRRRATRSLTEVMTERFNNAERLTIAITPEGTRSRNVNWRTGFLHIAYNAGVPIALGVIDYENKQVLVKHTFEATGDVDADMKSVKQFYAPFKGKYPEKFAIE